MRNCGVFLKNFYIQMMEMYDFGKQFDSFLLFIYLFILAVLDRHCCVWAFSSCVEWGLLFVVVRGLLIAVASLVAEHRL